MYAVIRTGGKQYRVAPGETIQVENLEGEVGGKVTFGDVVTLRTDENKFLSGENASKTKISGQIVSHGRHPKRVVLKFKRCGQYKITRGHRQGFTSVKLNDFEIA